MAALSSITAVKPTSNTDTRRVQYGATISAGQALYLDSATNKWKLADADSSATTAKARGIAITAGVDGDYGIVAVRGNIILVGTTAGVGKTYYVGNTAGQLVENSDLTSSSYVTEIGNAKTTTELRLGIDAKGYLHG